ncbi:class II aldolase/adducin family protein [Litorivivens sp.]|uniref:class II aldolase/adducin family protein n=1 Tax=Litorivivens sp. TaxID=2020868 RepID=UPI003563723A
MEPIQDFNAERVALCHALHDLGTARLSPGSTGNASVRVAGGMLISPTGQACANATSDDLVFVDDSGNTPAGQLKPSSEWHMHNAIYRHYPDAGAIVHCHSRFATTLAALRKGIPAYHYMVAVAGGDSIECADYATFGTDTLATLVVEALRNRSACLMANHGQIAYAATPHAALDLAIQVEDLAAGYYQCLAIGEPQLLTDREMREVLEKFGSYGQQD